MRENSIVVVNLLGPNERFFGRLQELTTAGITIRGIDLSAFDDWMNQLGQDEPVLKPSTVFFPLHRVEKIILDESVGPMPSLREVFNRKVGAPIDMYLE